MELLFLREKVRSAPRRSPFRRMLFHWHCPNGPMPHGFIAIAAGVVTTLASDSSTVNMVLEMLAARSGGRLSSTLATSSALQAIPFQCQCDRPARARSTFAGLPLPLQRPPFTPPPCMSG